MRPENSRPVVTVDAQMKANFEADVFVLNVDFEGECDERDECIDKYNADFEDVKNTLVEAGVPEADIKSREFKVYAHRSHKRRLIGRVKNEVTSYWYEGSCTVQGKLADGGVSHMWRALHRLTGDFSFDIDYQLSDPASCERQLLESAVEEAHERAQTLASASGAALGSVAGIVHHFNHVSVSNHESMSFGVDSIVPSPIGGGHHAPEFKPAEIEVHCAVTLSWYIK